MANSLQLDLPALSRRTLPGLGGIAKSLHSEVPSFTSAAVGLASQAQSVASSAVAAIHSDLSSVIPKNCSVGTRSFCVGFATSVNCSTLPLNISRLVAHAIPAINIPGLESDLASIDQKLKYVTPELIEGPLILGIVSTMMLLILLVVRCLLWSKEPYQLWTVPVDAVLGIIGFVICLACSVYLPIELRTITTMVEHSQFEVEKGNLMGSSIWILSFALVMAFCLGSVYFRKYVLSGMKGKLWKRADPQPRDRWADHHNYVTSDTHKYASPSLPQPSHLF